MARLIAFLFAFAAFQIALQAEIIETARMEEILPAIDAGNPEEIWVLFDIDDTLLESALQAGRTHWFYHQFKNRLAEGCEKQAVIDAIDKEYLKIVDICPIRIPEEETLALLHRIQQSGAKVMGLTARGPHLCPITLKQFERLGIDLSTHAPKTAPFENLSAGYFEKGVLFAVDQLKGPAFRQFIKGCEKRPGKIVFIDDQIRHLHELENEASLLGIPFVGFHYTKTKERPFDWDQAVKEHQMLLDQAKAI